MQITTFQKVGISVHISRQFKPQAKFNNVPQLQGLILYLPAFAICKLLISAHQSSHQTARMKERHNASLHAKVVGGRKINYNYMGSDCKLLL